MITIIGAGPAGSYLAYLLAKEGKEVIIFEEHSKIGRPVQCTGLVTASISKILKLDNSLVKNKIKKIRVYSPNNNFLELNLKNEELVLDREKFDSYLCKKATNAGAKLFLNHKFIDKKNNQLMIKDTENNKIKKIKTDVMVGADGPLSQVANVSGLFGKRKFYTGIQARVRLKTKKDTYETFFGKRFPNFFGWIVPENNSIARIGLATKNNPSFYFNDFIKLKKIKKKDIIEKQAGLIPIYNPRNKTQKGNTYLVGDAALQVKATTGGGIIQGLLAAQRLKESIIYRKNYEKEWKRRIGKELLISLLIRRTLNNCSDKDYNRLISLANKEKIKKILEKEDRDHPSKLLSKLLIKEPRFLYFSKLLLK